MVVSASLFAAAPKYVILFIGDGFSIPQRMVAEEFSRSEGRGELAVNHLKNHALTRTCSASSLITDSAAAATAIACGCKTSNGTVGLDKDRKRVESVAEVAHRKGRKVGIVSSCYITHATPAGFYAHRKHRGLLYQIGLDLIASGFDYFAGGGFGGKSDDRKDPEYRGNLYDLAAAAGYRVVTNRADFAALAPGAGKTLYAACDGHMPHAIDSDGSLPTLAELTSKGLELLDGPEGFFLMVEGGEIDFSGHANDAATNLRETMALDDAVRTALKFQAAHPDDTLLLVTGDHETGGMAMGFAGTGYALYVKRLACQSRSCGGFNRLLKEARKNAKKKGVEFTFADARPLLEDTFGFDFSSASADKKNGDDGSKFASGAATPDDKIVITPDDMKALEKAFADNKLSDAARRIISEKAGIGWSSGAHTALPVLTTSQGPCSDLFTGFIDNTDISNRLKGLYD